MIILNQRSKSMKISVKSVEGDHSMVKFTLKGIINAKKLNELNSILSSDAIRIEDVEDDGYLEGGTLAKFDRPNNSLHVYDEREQYLAFKLNNDTGKDDTIFLTVKETEELAKEIRLWLNDKDGDE